jgi:hypothetical protein
MTNEVGMFGPSPIKPEKLLRELIRGVKEHDSGRTLNKRGNKSWTEAVKSSLKEIAKKCHPASVRCYYTKAEPSMREFLLDVVWWDEGKFEGASLACECEWHRSPEAIREDFGKLLVIKAPLKLMIFASSNGRQSDLVRSKLEEYLKSYKHHVQGETYLVLDLVPEPRAWIARIERNGIANPDLTDFKF